MFKYYFFLLIIFSNTLAFTQTYDCENDITCEEIDTNLVIFTTIPTFINPDTNICIPIQINNFEFILALQQNCFYNPYNMTYTGYNAGNCIEQTFYIDPILEGIVRLLWLDSSAQGNCCEDESTLIELCFDIFCSYSNQVKIDTVITEEIAYGLDFSSDACYSLNSPQTQLDFATCTCNSLNTYYSVCCVDPNQNLNSLSFSVCGGVAPYQYSIEENNQIIAQGQNINDYESISLDSIPYGIYFITIVDILNDTIIQSIIIDTCFDDDFSLEIINPNCSRPNNGQIKIVNNNGNNFCDDYKIEWSNYRYVTKEIGGLTQGQYSVTITDKYNCKKVLSTLLEQDEFKMESIIIEPASCPEINDGIIKWMATGGESLSSIDSNVYNFNGQVTDCYLLDNLQAGDIIIVQATDGAMPSCEAIDTLIVPLAEPKPINPILVDGVSCLDSTCTYSLCSGDNLSMFLEFETPLDTPMVISIVSDTLKVTGGKDTIFILGYGTINEEFINLTDTIQNVLYQLTQPLPLCEESMVQIEIEILPSKTYFLDDDADGFGNNTDSITSCSVVQGYVLNNLDCNDQDITIHPNADELCDDQDNNCDGQIDEDLEFQNYYEDNDIDLFGNPSVFISACTQPDGYIINNSDCDDNDPNINPNIEDIPNNGIDEDCDGMDAISFTSELMNQTLTLKPNPINDVLHINYSDRSFTLVLYSMEGKRLLTKQNTQTIDVSWLLSGIYWVYFADNVSGNSITKKIIII